jgi:hypothetical protein
VQLLGQQARAAACGAPENGGAPEADPRMPQDPSAAGLAQQIGEGESLGVSSGVLQVPSYRSRFGSMHVS